MIALIKYCFDYIVTLNKPAIITNYLSDSAVNSRVVAAINDSHGIKSTYNITDENIINLAGGFPTDGFLECSFQAYSIPDGVYKTKMLFYFGKNIITGEDKFGIIERTIDFKNKTIYNDQVQLQQKGNGTGTNIFLNQVNECFKLSFKSIEMTAAGPDYIPRGYWDGYKTWAKYGYLMKPGSLLNFRNWAKSHGFEETSLNDLFFNKVNYPTWENQGFSWEGYFEVNKNSRSTGYLKRYLISKHLNVRLSSFRSV